MQSDGGVTFQEISEANSWFLWEFLSIAAHEGNLNVVKSNPDLARYAAGFNVQKDFGWIAYLDDPTIDCPVGAVWVQHWDDPKNRGFAFVSSDIPELALGVRTEYQGKGIGTALLQKLLEEASSRERPGISLSVRDSNPALRLYQRLGFTTLDAISNRVGGHSFTMVKLLDPETIVLRSFITKDDIPSILSLLRKKAEFDQTMADLITPFAVTEEKLDVALLQKNYAYVILADHAQHGPVGMALYYFRFSSFSGQPYIWLEDLFVDDSYRGQGVGTRLLHRLADIANAHGTSCSNGDGSINSTPVHMEWVASARNKQGLLFYEKLGAQIVQKHGHTCTLQWRLDNTAISK